MIIFDIPLQAQAENAAYSVLDRTCSEELLVDPSKDSYKRFYSVRGQSNPIVVSSQLCGGTYCEMLTEFYRQYGEKLYLLLDPVCCLLPLPTAEAKEKIISFAQSRMLRTQAAVLECEAFFCEYCIIFEQNKPFLHLFDTIQTVEKKLSFAQKLGIGHVIRIEKAL